MGGENRQASAAPMRFLGVSITLYNFLICPRVHVNIFEANTNSPSMHALEGVVVLQLREASLVRAKSLNAAKV